MRVGEPRMYGKEDRFVLNQGPMNSGLAKNPHYYFLFY